MAMKPDTPPDVMHLAFDWVVQQVRMGELPPVEEQEFVDATIDLANLASEDTDQIMQIYYTLTMRPHGYNRWERRTAVEKVQTEEIRAFRGEEIPRVLKEAQVLAREVLRDLLDNPKKARLRHARKVTLWISKLEFYGIPKFERSTLRYENALCVASPMVPPGGPPVDLKDLILPMVGWALAVLLDKNRKTGHYLHQCRLCTEDSQCEKLFLALPEKDGGRPARYCSPEHTATARLQQAARRAQRYRNRVATRHK